MNNPSTTKFHILSNPISASHADPHGPAAAAEPASGAPAGGGARRGRPTVYSDKVFAMMKDYARRLGFSDTAAAEGVGVSSSTISRWKKECPEIAHELQTARQECRVHHLERMMQFAEGDNNRGLRATMWLLERLYPGDYAPRMSERFAYQNFEDRNREREEEELKKERQAEAKAEREAEAHAKYLAALAACEAEIAQHAAAAAAAQETKSDPPAGPAPEERENAASASESDSHNSRNSGAAEPADSDAPAERPQQPAEGPELAEGATAARRQQPAAVQGVAGGHIEEMHFSSESDSHNSRNASAAEPAADSDAHTHPSQQAASAAKRQPAAALQGVASGQREPMHFSSVSDSHNSRNSSPSLVPAAPQAGISLIF